MLRSLMLGVIPTNDHLGHPYVGRGLAAGTLIRLNAWLAAHSADWDWMNFFVSMLIVGIGVALLATGIFTSYFGAGKSQKIGFALLFFGLFDSL